MSTEATGSNHCLKVKASTNGNRPETPMKAYGNKGSKRKKSVNFK